MNKNIEMMKKIIEEKKKQSSVIPVNKRGEKVIGLAVKAKRSKKGGGIFDR